MLRERTELVRNVVMPIVRRSAKAAIEDGWRAGTSGAFIHTETGHWGQVAVRVQVARGQDVSITAGALSPYLMRVVNRLDPDRYPPPDFIAAHAQTEWFQSVVYDVQHSGPPTASEPGVADPSAGSVAYPAPPVVLGPDCAQVWFEQRIRHLIRKTTPLLSDAGLLDWMLQPRFPGDGTWPRGTRRDLRLAIILARHLGRLDLLPQLLEEDARDFERRMAVNPIDPETQARLDRRRGYEPFSTPGRFARWLDGVPT